MSVTWDEREWRLLAQRVRPLLRGLVADAGAAADLARDLDRALDLPTGPAAKRELRRLLTRLPEVREWLRGEAPGEEGYRAAPPPGRFLHVSAPENVTVGQRVPLFVQITLRESGQAATLKSFDVPPEGARVVVSIAAPTLVVVGDMQCDLTVPAERDSDPAQFGLIAPAAGLHRVVVMVHRGGTFLGETSLRLAADVELRWQEETVRTAPIASMHAEPGEVTLLVERNLDQYWFQLLGEVPHEGVRQRLAADPSEIVERMTGELTRMASGHAALDSPALVRRRLIGMGAELWGVVPDKVREHYWAQADRIASLTVISRLDVVPWELLYPVDGDREDGFLVGRIPVMRRIHKQQQVRRLAVPRVTYVAPVPPDGSEHDVDCAGELTAVRARLAGVQDRGVIADLDEVLSLGDADLTGILHFAGHHRFSSDEGSCFALEGGELRPGLLERAARGGRWHSRPLVFLNGCRTAGETPTISTNTGWAEKFLRIGAGAFIGSLWGVRSESAAQFADRFYEQFYQRGESLGHAMLAARQEIMDEPGDPTWLAYTAYGTSATTVAGR